MRVKTFVIISLWLLALAMVAAFAVVKATTPTPPARAAADVPLFDDPADADGKLPTLFETPSFTLTDQNGRPFGSDDLKGKVWVGFIFLTHCPSGACPVMTGKMANLAKTIPDDRVNFVSFTIDPERDTPEALKVYAEKVSGGTVSDRWHLLTGEARAKMYELATSMKLTFDDENQHSTQFLLVDTIGTVRGIYGNTDPDAMAKLQRDAKQLLGNGGK